jgi:FtsZ-interacting cell division protein YlmF
MGLKDFIKGFGLEGEGQVDNERDEELDEEYEEDEYEGEEEEMEQEYENEKAVSIRVFRPKKFEEATEIAANLLQGSLIFLNLEIQKLKI